MTAEPNYNDVIALLRNDKQSGSTTLALKTLNALYAVLQYLQPLSRAQLEKIVAELIAVRPSMVVIRNALTRCLEQLQPSNPSVTFKPDYLHAITNVTTQLEHVNERVAQHACDLIKPGMTVMVHSRSSQIISVFKLLAKQHCDVRVIVTASAPGNEGFLMAEELNQLHIPTIVITDAEMGLFMPEIDLNLCGCDSWLTDHHFVNKSGTLLQALAAQHFGKPFWVLADSFKNSGLTSAETTLEVMPASELNAPNGQFIQTANIYFETIPTELLSGRIDEHGLHSNP